MADFGKVSRQLCKKLTNSLLLPVSTTFAAVMSLGCKTPKHGTFLSLVNCNENKVEINAKTGELSIHSVFEGCGR